MLPHHPHILLIAGTGRNSGKTNLACRIIGKFAETSNVYALKISPHLHREPQPQEALIKKPNYFLYEESGANPKKDSARMLAAGAERSYYLEVKDDHLNDAIYEFYELLPGPVPLVIESPALIRHLIPGLFIIVDNPLTVSKKKEILKLKYKADWYIENGSEISEKMLDSLRCDESGWRFASKI